MTAATNRRDRRATARPRRRAGVGWSARAARQRRGETATFTYSDPMLFTVGYGPSGRLATYVYDSQSKRRRIYEGLAFTTIVWDRWDYLQWRYPGGDSPGYDAACIECCKKMWSGDRTFVNGNTYLQKCLDYCATISEEMT